jgi:hypothetical protein
MSSPLTAYATTNQGWTYGGSTTYATARSTVTDAVGSTYGDVVVGQIFSSPTYYVYEALIGFDTSSIPVGSTIVSVVLSLYPDIVQTANGGTWTVDAVAKDFGASADGSDWVAGANLAALTVLASLTCDATHPATGAYRNFTSAAAFLTAIVCGGQTRLLLSSSKHNAGTAPTGQERIYFFENVTNKWPRLVVTYTEPSTFIPRIIVC